MKRVIQGLLTITILLSALTVTTSKSYAQFKGYTVPKSGGGYDIYGGDYTLKGYTVPKKFGGYDFYGSDNSLKGYAVPKLGRGYDTFDLGYSLKSRVYSRLDW